MVAYGVSLLVRVCAAGMLWASLAGTGDPATIGAGAVAVALAVGASLRLLPPRGRLLRPGPLLRLALLFLSRSLVASFDVAFRALRPGPPVAPGLAAVPVALPTATQRALLRTFVSLVPGTLGIRDEGERLVLHLLDGSDAGAAAARAEVQRIEILIAAAAGGGR